MSERTVVWYRPGKPVKAWRGELSLENMQRLVGGKIQIVPLEPKSSFELGYTLVCNEDGKNKFFNQPLFPLLDNKGNTVDVVFGPCFIAGRLMQGEDGSEDFLDINREDYLKIVRRFGKGVVEDDEVGKGVEQKLTASRDRQLIACRNMLAKLEANRAARLRLSRSSRTGDNGNRGTLPRRP